jgi:hypothetical protein
MQQSPETQNPNRDGFPLSQSASIDVKDSFELAVTHLLRLRGTCNERSKLGSSCDVKLTFLPDSNKRYFSDLAFKKDLVG